MASPQRMTTQDELMRLKQLEKERKMKERDFKRQEKMRKHEQKRLKQLEKRRIKLAKKGIILPELKPEPEKVTPAVGRAAPAPEERLPEAEVITAEADVWTPRSARNIDEIQKRIDRMDKKMLSSLKERYKTKYGEDLEIPDAYNVETTIDIETAERLGELEAVEKVSKDTAAASTNQISEGKSEKKGFGLGFGKKGQKTKDKSKEKVKLDTPVRFLDLRKPMYLYSKLTTPESGMGKKIILGLLDVIILLICFISVILILIRIIGTIVYIRRDRQDQELLASMRDESLKPQPSA